MEAEHGGNAVIRKGGTGDAAGRWSAHCGSVGLGAMNAPGLRLGAARRWGSTAIDAGRGEVPPGPRRGDGKALAGRD